MKRDYGLADERGAANLVDLAATRRGIESASSGSVISLGQPIRRDGLPIPAFRSAPMHFMTRDGGDYAAGLAERAGMGFADDSVLLSCHGTTHIDALSHVWKNGVMYGGFSSNEVTSRGAKKLGVEKVGPLVCRGLLVDAAPRGALGLEPSAKIDVRTLQAALAGVQPQPGDALIIRTGWPEVWRSNRSIGTDSWPGLDSDSVDWIVDSGFAVVGADTIGVEVSPSSDPTCASPLHIALMRDHGIYFLELLALEELTAALSAAGRPDFLLVIAPLPIEGAVGSPVAPVAVI